MRRFPTIVFAASLALAFATSGCTRRLMIQPDENPALSAGKIAIRVPLAVLSFGMSEVMADCVRETARETGLPVTPNSPVWDICNGRSDIAAYRASMAGAAQGIATAPPVAAAAPAPTPTRTRPLQTDCTTDRFGNVHCSTW
jgi:hypothetical protein